MKNKHAQQLGKLGGQVKSEAKAKAVRENGKLGGRPKKEQECPLKGRMGQCSEGKCFHLQA